MHHPLSFKKDLLHHDPSSQSVLRCLPQFHRAVTPSATPASCPVPRDKGRRGHGGSAPVLPRDHQHHSSTFSVHLFLPLPTLDIDPMFPKRFLLLLLLYTQYKDAEVTTQ